MYPKCKHPKVTVRTVSYRPIAARHPNPVATGNITIIETCQKCGAVRATNANANQTETTGWTTDKK